MATYSKLDNIPPTTSAKEFFETYIAKRQPVVIQGLLDDESFKAKNWVSPLIVLRAPFQRVTGSCCVKTDLAYLEAKAGDSDVLVEPMHPTAHQFGTAVERVPMKFGDYLKQLRGESGSKSASHAYLTTQYAAQDSDDEDDSLTVLPPPTDALEHDFPRVPRLMGNLFLQQRLHRPSM
ncbi:hypothetical protein NM688_g1740 [Phlebia brevispora]|uniref:Uncharacterized protein n=1 Tax=Phlebia brevispora TaxID=194682 RepID=A0ACC1TB90_9APHY|nr:hypothetical protein NM688_g1740 [Phlebia brevispora]